MSAALTHPIDSVVGSIVADDGDNQATIHLVASLAFSVDSSIIRRKPLEVLRYFSFTETYAELVEASTHFFDEYIEVNVDYFFLHLIENMASTRAASSIISPREPGWPEPFSPCAGAHSIEVLCKRNGNLFRCETVSGQQNVSAFRLLFSNSRLFSKCFDLSQAVYRAREQSARHTSCYRSAPQKYLHS